MNGWEQSKGPAESTGGKTLLRRTWADRRTVWLGRLAPPRQTSGSRGSSPAAFAPKTPELLGVWFLLLCAVLSSCSSRQVKAPERYHYTFVNNKTALVQNGHAKAPRKAPKAVHRAIEAGNNLQMLPYRYGGGHRDFNDTGYDCSGTVSYVLNRAGVLDRTMTSSEFLEYGKPGPGRWITVYVRPGHVFVTVAGLRLDTGGTYKDTGPRWKPFSRKTSKFVVRHPPGL